MCYIVGLKDFIDKVSREALFITLTWIVGDKGTCDTEGFLQKCTCDSLLSLNYNEKYFVYY